MISIIYPSRNRPHLLSTTIKRWISNADLLQPIQVLVSLDSDDKTRPDELWVDDVKIEIIIGENRSAIDAINRAAPISIGHILFVISDDTECFSGWDTKLLKEVEGKTDWILKTQDGIQDYIITNPIMDRAYYNRTGYIYHPSYQHLFADTELTCVADLLNRKIKSNLMFKHNHYSVNGTAPDDLHKRNDATWKQGEENFIKRYRNNFDLINPPGRISDTSMNNWLRQKSR